jgi:hypothetical protein
LGNVRAKFFSGLKVQISDYFSKSASVTWEIYKSSSSRYGLADQEKANLLPPLLNPQHKV